MLKTKKKYVVICVTVLDLQKGGRNCIECYEDFFANFRLFIIIKYFI